MTVSVGLRRLPGRDPDLPLPAYATAGAAGMDVAANLAPEARATGLAISSGARALVPTGLAVAIPEGYEVQVRPRSGLALRHGVTVLNSPGTVDSDYRGELCVILANLGDAPFTVEHGMRIAQLVLAPVVRLAWDERAALDESARGAGGFGSTGTESGGDKGAPR
jgi:dUTP pyrophosphatase